MLADLTLPGAMEDLEVAMIRRALDDDCSSQIEAAGRLGIDGPLHYEEVRRHGIIAATPKGFGTAVR